MNRTRRRRWRALAATVALLAGTLGLHGCGGDETATPELAMPDLVGMTVGDAEAQTYDALHTSLIYYDLAPLDREAANDWVVVATTPAAGDRTPKFEKVYAFALRKSEYDWFTQHPSMPRIPARADVATLLAPGGLLADVKDLVRVRYQPGRAAKGAKTDPDDAAAFDPDRGLRPDLAAEPATEWQLRKGLLVAPAKGTISVGTRPAAATTLRVGQLLVLLVTEKPEKKPEPATAGGGSDVPDFSGIGSGGSGGSGGGSGGSGGSGGGGNPGLPGGFPTKIPNCPRQICG